MKINPAEVARPIIRAYGIVRGTLGLTFPPCRRSEYTVPLTVAVSSAGAQVSRTFPD